MQAYSRAHQKPKEFRQVIMFISIMGVSWFLYWLLNGLFLKQWMMGSLMFTAICIVLLLIVYKVRGMLVFLISLPVFTAFTAFELFYSLSGLIPLLSDFLSNRVDFSTGVARTASYIVNSITGFLSAVIVFYLLTSEDLNTYLDTEAIFPIRRKIFVGELKESVRTEVKEPEKTETESKLGTAVESDRPRTIVVPEKASYNEIIPFLTLPLSNLISTRYGCKPIKEVEIYGIKYKCCKLGFGGWGSVYLCERENERIVVKMPFRVEATFLGYEKPTDYSKLTQQPSELEFLKSLNHPNILKLIDIKGPFLFYEYADYGSLAWQLANGYRPSLNDILLLVVQIGDALRYVHSRGIIHGDIKPSNILLVGGVAKLSDFSSAKLVVGISLSKIPSTYGYKAPEQVYAEWKKKAKQMGIENKVDIYQLGSTLLHALTGKPLDGEDASEEEVTKRTEGLDERIAALLREMLSIDPAKRPSAEEIVKRAYTLLKKTA